MNKTLKIWGFRGSMMGDCVAALPILTFLEKKYPDSYKYWQIARKCAQCAPIYFNHPLIDKIVISDCDEGIGPKDKLIMDSCDIKFNLMPQHPLEQDWPNYRNIYEETWLMAGLSMSDYNLLSAEEKKPKLYKWFETTKLSNKKSIALWAGANYGKDNFRCPSLSWYNKLSTLLMKNGYEIFQFGHPKDIKVDHSNDLRNLSFFDQIKQTLSCDIMIGGDSGSSLIIGAYELIPQVSLLTRHWYNHKINDTAFATNSGLNYNFCGTPPDSINQEEIIKHINHILK